MGAFCVERSSVDRLLSVKSIPLKLQVYMIIPALPSLGHSELMPIVLSLEYTFSGG